MVLSLGSLLSVSLSGCQAPWRPWEAPLFDGPGVSLAGTAKSSRRSPPGQTEIILGSTQASALFGMAALKMMDLAKENNNSTWLGENWSLTMFPLASRRSIEIYCKDYWRDIYSMVVSTQPVSKDLLQLCARHRVPPLIEIPIASSAIAFVVADNNHLPRVFNWSDWPRSFPRLAISCFGAILIPVGLEPVCGLVGMEPPLAKSCSVLGQAIDLCVFLALMILRSYWIGSVPIRNFWVLLPIIRF